MDDIDRRLLNEFQRDFPLTPHPYAEIGRRLGITEIDVRHRLASLRDRGAVSRVGAVIRPNTLGASTLAALSVPEDDVERVAAIVSGFVEVNHNYMREHAYNMWFVVVSDSREQVVRVLDAISAATGYRPLDLPMLEEFHIDLGFQLRWN